MTDHAVSPAGSYPVMLQASPTEAVARWRPLVQWLLVIPHLIIAEVLQLVGAVMTVVAWFAGLFTGRISEGIQGPIALSIRYTTRATAYAAFMHQTYPPFSFDMSLADPGDHPPLRVDFAPEVEERNRLTIFFRILLIIPAAIVLGLVAVVAYVMFFIAFFVVLVTGRWPVGLYDFAVGFLRWTTRVSAYGYLLTDEYPPFSLS